MYPQFSHSRNRNYVGVCFGIWLVRMVIIIAFWGLVALMAIKGCNKIQDKGLKNVVSTVWEGPTNFVSAK